MMMNLANKVYLCLREKDVILVNLHKIKEQ